MKKGERGRVWKKREERNEEERSVWKEGKK